MSIKTAWTKWVEIAVLLLVSAIVYLPLVGALTYYKDDWYLIYAGHTQGPAIYADVFSIDRPARGVLMGFLYSIFGNHALYYNLSAYAFRVLGALAFLYLLRRVWPEMRKPALLMAILFLVYPGYLSWTNAIDFQSHVVSLCLAIFSILLSVGAVFLQRPLLRFWTILAAVFLGWAYIALVEYSIGLEAFRLACLFLVISRRVDENVLSKFRATLAHAWIYLAIPAGFFFWQSVLFENARRATDLGDQLSVLLASPGLTMLWWAVRVFQDFCNVTFLAWAVPLYQVGFQSRLRDVLAAFAISLAVVLVIQVALGKKLFEGEEVEKTSSDWRPQALAVGAFTVIASLLPVVFANRHVNFEEFSRYALPGSAGGVMALVSVFYFLSSVYLRMAIVYGLMIIAAFTHYANAAAAAITAASVREFWWQVSWRAPQIAAGTTLVAHYAESGVPEDYVVWGPANLIYFPERHAERPVPISIAALILDNQSIAKVLAESNSEQDIGRGTISFPDYGNILAISQPNFTACVHIFDGSSPEFSIHEDARIMLVAPKSNPSNVLAYAQPRLPPESIFGREPTHDWCYFFQKADLARQRGEWENVAGLGEQAGELGLHPNDQIEWMPFLQAYAISGDVKQMKHISTLINTEPAYKRQACRILTTMPELAPEMQSYAGELFCRPADLK